MPDDSAPTATRCLLAAALSLIAAVLGSAGPAHAQIVELPRVDSTAGDFFGTAVAIDGPRVLIGATAVNSCGSNSGAAYIYEHRPVADEWVVAARLVPSDCSEGKFFGRSVSLSGDVAVIAASQEFFSQEAPNAAYVFERDRSGTWRETTRLTGGSQDEEGAFATSVSVDGKRILVTAAGDPVHGRFGGAAYVFEKEAFEKEAFEKEAFEKDGEWRQTARLTGGSSLRHGIFGTTGSLRGDLIAVAASTYFRNRPGSIYIFERRSEAGWDLTARIGGVEDFFISIDAAEGRIIAGESKADGDGAALIVDRGSDWRVSQTLKPAEPYDSGAFGSTVALDDDLALVVGYDEQLGLEFNIDRVVFVFKRNRDTGRWGQHFVIDVGELAFGASLDLHGKFAVIGSASDTARGTAYIVRIPD